MSSVKEGTKGKPSDLRSSAWKTSTGSYPTIRVMVVGDSLSQGQQGDWTWRYRIWQFFKQNSVAVQFVGPYTGTELPASAPPPSSSSSNNSPTPQDETTGGYARGVDSEFLSNSNHFAVSGQAAAIVKGLIQDVLQDIKTDLVLLMLGFNDMGWFHSDAYGTLDSIDTLIANARAANPSLKFAVANVPQRSFMSGREDLVENTKIYNGLLRDHISKWTTKQSPIHLVELEQNYECQPDSCPAGYDGLHPNAWGEFQIASAFSQTLMNDFGLGTSPLAVPSRDDPSLSRDLPIPSNLWTLASSKDISVTWDAVYGAYSYDVQITYDGNPNTSSIITASSDRWESAWPSEGRTCAVAVRASAGDNIRGQYTATLSVTAEPQHSSQSVQDDFVAV